MLSGLWKLGLANDVFCETATHKRATLTKEGVASRDTSLQKTRSSRYNSEMKRTQRHYLLAIPLSVGVIAILVTVVCLANQLHPATGVMLCAGVGIVLRLVSLAVGRVLNRVRRLAKSRNDDFFEDLTLIEFIGGPFDGAAQAFSSPPTSKMLGLPVTANIDVPFAASWTPGTNLAVYKQRRRNGRWRYEFVEYLPGRESKLGRDAPVIQAALEARRRTVGKTASEGHQRWLRGNES